MDWERWGRWDAKPRTEATPAPADTLVWRVRKGERSACLHLRQHPLGVELRATVDRAESSASGGADLVWSEVVRDGRTVGAIADEHLQRWVERGWTLVSEAPRA